MTLLDSGSTNPVVNGHTQKPSNSGHFNIESASGISMRDAGIAVTSGMGLDNPFYAISAELQYLSSGVSLSLEPESRGQEDAGLDGSGIQSRREGGGREWMEAVRRVKDFVERSDDKIYQISPTDPSVSDRISSSRRLTKRIKRTRPEETVPSKLEMNGQAAKRGRTSSYRPSTLRIQSTAGSNEEAEIYPEVPRELLDLIYLPFGQAGAGPSSSPEPGQSDSARMDEAMQVDLPSGGRRSRGEGDGRVSIWSTRDDLVKGLKRISMNGLLCSAAGTGMIPGTGTGAVGTPEVGPGSSPGPSLELGLEDYWPSPRSTRRSTTGKHKQVEGDPEFTLKFRLEGCFRGWVVFGPRVPRNRPRGAGEEDAGHGGLGDGSGIQSGMRTGRGDGEGRMMAVRFNIFADTEPNKGKNDLSAYKTMVDLGRYLTGLELDVGETLDRLRAYEDLMSRACFVCGRLQASSLGSGTVGVAGPGVGVGPTGAGVLPIGRARASSDDQPGWRAYHLDCLPV